MSPRKKTRPRKHPAQERSRATVDAILHAAVYILRREGWPRLTTKRIAEKAGVNIASLYQYFPNKEAVVAELHRRFLADVHARMQANPQEESTGNDSLPSLIRQGVSGAMATLAVDPEMHRVFVEELPASFRTAEPIDAGLLERFHRSVKRKMVGVPDPELAMWIWDEVMDALARAACAKRPDLLADARFAEEVSLLIERYLIRD